jgi:hypothetical protein
MEIIIDSKGNIKQAWFMKDGVIIHDHNKYGYDWAIGVEYSDEQKERYAEIKALKKQLAQTDYKALKYADGCYTEEEYAPIKAQRADARTRINALEFEKPTLTSEQIDQAERIAIEKLKKGH